MNKEQGILNKEQWLLKKAPHAQLTTHDSLFITDAKKRYQQ